MFVFRSLQHFSGLAEKYRSQLHYARNEGARLTAYIEVRSSLSMRLNHIYDDNYVNHYYDADMNNKTEWIRTLAKLSPVKFNNRSIDFNSSWLLDQHNSQLKFCNKILPIVDNIKFIGDDKTSTIFLLGYIDFLKKHKYSVKSGTGDFGHLTTPTLIQDFVWHSHMLDHENYVSDMKRIFGRILDHRTDIHTDKNTRGSSCSSACSAIILPILDGTASINSDSGCSTSCSGSSCGGCGGCGT